MAQPSWEYERLISSSHSLRIAFQDQLISLSEDLHADGMISNDNKTEVLNPSTSLPNRASKLVDLVTNRVKFMKEDYQTFVALLRRNQRAYKPILVIFGEGQPHYHNSISVDETVQLDPVEANVCTVQGSSVKASPPYKASTVTIYPSMTDEEFFSALEIEGLPKEDCEILKDNKIKAKTFIMDLTESDFDGSDLGKFTFIGKRILKRILQSSKQRSKVQEKSSAAATVSTKNAEMRRREIGSGSLKGNLFGSRKDYSYDVPEGVVHVSLSKEDKSEGAFSIGSGTGNVTLKWDKAAKKAYVHAWVNGSVGSNHVTWTIYGWI